MGIGLLSVVLGCYGDVWVGRIRGTASGSAVGEREAHAHCRLVLWLSIGRYRYRPIARITVCSDAENALLLFVEEGPHGS
ncbi:hypothetical protein [Micromonospora sp. 067-2]|uniref:hypothetical protein n=1 Tax=Micromonospora sp. 067-2 TaxID=2789270 RepID=UPI00397CC01B